ncbi:MAG: hypothetical protein ACRDPS_10830 [Nocardioides sp.]|uniref:hypothetical protein n=1 Tax=Nocardioides sp. TaxID=35761 RepID=UPI003D6A3542
MATADDPNLASQFSPDNQDRMREGKAPFVKRTQQFGGRKNYELHHITPRSRGGAEFDLNNLVVVTPLFHRYILDGSYHFGGGTR